MLYISRPGGENITSNSGKMKTLISASPKRIIMSTGEKKANQLCVSSLWLFCFFSPSWIKALLAAAPKRVHQINCWSAIFCKSSDLINFLRKRNILDLYLNQ
jgi:hypothetical protein